MLRIRDADAIGRIGTYQKEQADALDTAFEKLKKDVNNLLSSYHSSAAQQTVASFLNGINNYQKVIEKIRQYGDYQESIFKNDSENISKTTKEINELLNEQLDDTQITVDSSFNSENIGEQTFNLEKLVIEGDSNE